VAALYHLKVWKHSGWAQLIWQTWFCRYLKLGPNYRAGL